MYLHVLGYNNLIRNILRIRMPSNNINFVTANAKYSYRGGRDGEKRRREWTSQGSPSVLLLPCQSNGKVVPAHVQNPSLSLLVDHSQEMREFLGNLRNLHCVIYFKCAISVFKLTSTFWDMIEMMITTIQIHNHVILFLCLIFILRSSRWDCAMHSTCNIHYLVRLVRPYVLCMYYNMRIHTVILVRFSAQCIQRTGLCVPWNSSLLLLRFLGWACARQLRDI